MRGPHGRCADAGRERSRPGWRQAESRNRGGTGAKAGGPTDKKDSGPEHSAGAGGRSRPGARGPAPATKERGRRGRTAGGTTRMGRAGDKQHTRRGRAAPDPGTGSGTGQYSGGGGLRRAGATRVGTYSFLPYCYSALFMLFNDLRRPSANGHPLLTSPPVPAGSFCSGICCCSAASAPR